MIKENSIFAFLDKYVRKLVGIFSNRAVLICNLMDYEIKEVKQITIFLFVHSLFSEVNFWENMCLKIVCFKHIK